MRVYCCLILSLSFALMIDFARDDEPVTSCHDVTRLDFKNLTISRGKRIFAFKDGVAHNYEIPEIEKSGPPDWNAEIERDTVVHPIPDVTLRFLLIKDSHLTGTGWNFWLVGYSCSNGHLRQVFSRDGLSLEIERLDNSGIVVSKLLKYGSPIKTRWSYIWEKAQSKYVLALNRRTDETKGR